MAMTVSRISGVLLLGFSLVRCNLEVGNPDKNGPDPIRRSELKSITVRLIGYEPCSTGETHCAALPVRFAENSILYTFEMNEARLHLQSITLAPYSEQQTPMPVDLLLGASVSFGENVEGSAVTSAALYFAVAGDQSLPTYELSGNLLFKSGTMTYKVPLTLAYTEAITASTAISRQETEPWELSFDASTWFDFSGNAENLVQLGQNLLKAGCNDTTLHPCQKPAIVLSKIVAQRIGQSLRQTQKRGKEIFTDENRGSK